MKSPAVIVEKHTRIATKMVPYLGNVGLSGTEYFLQPATFK